MTKQQVWKLRQPVVLWGTLGLAFGIAMMAHGLAAMVLSMLNKWPLTAAGGVVIYLFCLLSFVPSILLLVYGLLAFNKKRCLAAMEKAINIVRWIGFYNPFGFLLARAVRGAISEIKALKLANYPIISMRAVRALVFQKLSRELSDLEPGPDQTPRP